MGKAFTRADLPNLQSKLLRDGHVFNAVVSLVVGPDGRRWTVKDFSSRPWYVRLVARLLLSHELTILSRLKGIDGVAEESFRIDGNSLAILFQEGEVLANIQPERVTAQYLIKLEELTRVIHRAGVVHLDMRTYSNILIRPDDTPAVIDFQAAQTTWWMPSFLRKKLEDIDMSGAYKKWERFQPGLMGEERKRELVRINKLRDLWVIRGYFGAHVKKEKR